MYSALLTLVKSFDFATKAVSWAVRIFVLLTLINAIPFTFGFSPEMLSILTSERVIDTLRVVSYFAPVSYIFACIGVLLLTKHWRLIYNMFLRIFDLIFGN